MSLISLGNIIFLSFSLSIALCHFLHCASLIYFNYKLFFFCGHVREILHGHPLESRKGIFTPPWLRDFPDPFPAVPVRGLQRRRPWKEGCWHSCPPDGDRPPWPGRAGGQQQVGERRRERSGAVPCRAMPCRVRGQPRRSPAPTWGRPCRPRAAAAGAAAGAMLRACRCLACSWGTAAPLCWQPGVLPNSRGVQPSRFLCIPLF